MHRAIYSWYGTNANYPLDFIWQLSVVSDKICVHLSENTYYLSQ